MKTIASSTARLRNESGYGELFGVLLEQLFIYIGKNFIKSGKFILPKAWNLGFYLNSYRFVMTMVDVIRLYKTDYEGFKEKYIKAAQEQYFEIDRYFGNL